MKEPWIRVVKKAELGKRETLILRLEAIVLALVAGGFFILLIGQNPFVIYQTIVTGALRSEMAIQATVKIMIPLLIASLRDRSLWAVFLPRILPCSMRTGITGCW